MSVPDVFGLPHLSEDAVAAFADGVLTPTATARAQRHCAECDECAAAVRVQREAMMMLRSAPTPSLPSGLMARLSAVPMSTQLPPPMSGLPTVLGSDGVPVFVTYRRPPRHHLPHRSGGSRPDGPDGSPLAGPGRDASDGPLADSDGRGADGRSNSDGRGADGHSNSDGRSADGHSNSDGADFRAIPGIPPPLAAAAPPPAGRREARGHHNARRVVLPIGLLASAAALVAVGTLAPSSTASNQPVSPVPPAANIGVALVRPAVTTSDSRNAPLMSVSGSGPGLAVLESTSGSPSLSITPPAP
ncbi:MAG: hypothetical protein JWN95_2212 [Frankiales bacterium]|nr:hypothetical protein [Frankiales bacterium]